jgi:excisionase family DNA binding protein
MLYLTTGEVARRCQVSVGTVKNWIEAGQLEAFRTPGRRGLTWKARAGAMRRS